MATLNEWSLDLTQKVMVQATIEEAYEAMIRRLGPENSTPDNQPMPMVLEERPGGRWFRDLGDDQGHLWGFVQVIKPPRLLEIHGPMFMSYAAAGHLQLRLNPVDDQVEITLRHRVIGMIDDNHRAGLTQGWGYFLESVQGMLEARE